MEDTILREKDDAARQEREKLYQQLKEMEDMKRENVLLKVGSPQDSKTTTDLRSTSRTKTRSC